MIYQPIDLFFLHFVDFLRRGISRERFSFAFQFVQVVEKYEEIIRQMQQEFGENTEQYERHVEILMNKTQKQFRAMESQWTMKTE